MNIILSENKNIDKEKILSLYEKNKWSAAKKPEALVNALQNSHSLISAWHKNTLIGLGNAITDGYLVVYYPHLLVDPDYHGKGIGKMIMDRFENLYSGFHQQILVADGQAIEFYKKCGFEKAGNCMPLWKYKGNEH